MNTIRPLNIAIIGSGISGLACAHVLNHHHAVTLFEANDYVGGHTHTIDTHCGDQAVAVDTGFIVYNERTYPNFIRLLEQLGVASQATNMSFSVSEVEGDFEYASNLSGLLARKRNVVDKRFLIMLRDKFRFDKLCKKLLSESPDTLNNLTLGSFLKQHRFSDAFARYYILPMTAAVWSAPFSTAEQYPMLALSTFLYNHGLLGVNEAPTWRVIKGGSREYVRALLKRFTGDLRLNSPVLSVKRKQGKVCISSQSGQQAAKTETFDHVIFACHSDQALALLTDPSEQEKIVLGDIAYQPNQAILHTDTSLLPARKRAYAAWNYKLSNNPSDNPTLTYNMNQLQGLHTADTFCVTLNQSEAIAPEKIIRTIDYAHPVYTPKTIAAQARWNDISGKHNTHYCGAYWFNGFHEDGIRSGLRVCEQFGLSLDDSEALFKQTPYLSQDSADNYDCDAA